MKHGLWNKRMPSLLALLIIIGSIGFTSFLVQTGIIPFLKAAPSETPVNVRITNVTDTSFTVTFTTNADVSASCLIDKQVQLDERDTATGVLTPHHVHSIVVKNLKPQTQYTFSILSGNTTYVDNGKPFSITTGPVINTNPVTHNPVIGKIILPSGDNPQEALIYATVQGGQTISSLVKDTGAYILPLTGMRSTNLSSYISFANIKTLQLLAETQDLASQVTASLQNSNPLPLITLGDDYDFTLNVNPLPTSGAPSQGFTAFFTLNTNATPQINVPSQNQNFTDSQPLLKGTALPNSTVEITIHSTNIVSGVVTADAYGNWTYRPPQLSPGTHTVTIATRDKSGILQTVQQTFNILESGTQVAEAATPSATTVPPTPTPLPAAPTSAPTTVPTITPVPTASSIVPPTTPTLPVVSTTLGPSITPGKKLPPTGNASAIPTALTGIITTIIGIGIFVFTRGAL